MERATTKRVLRFLFSYKLAWPQAGCEMKKTWWIKINSYLIFVKEKVTVVTKVRKSKKEIEYQNTGYSMPIFYLTWVQNYIYGMFLFLLCSFRYLMISCQLLFQSIFQSCVGEPLFFTCLTFIFLLERTTM